MEIWGKRREENFFRRPLFFLWKSTNWRNIVTDYSDVCAYTKIHSNTQRFWIHGGNIVIDCVYRRYVSPIFVDFFSAFWVLWTLMLDNANSLKIGITLKLSPVPNLLVPWSKSTTKLKPTKPVKKTPDWAVKIRSSNYSVACGIYRMYEEVSGQAP